MTLKTRRDRHDLTSEERKQMPVHRGALNYFPDALMLVSMLSARANAKHAPGQPIQWVKGKSADHGDCLVRHQCDVGTIDKEMGLDFAIHVAWRALAQLQTLVETHGIDSLVDWLHAYPEETARQLRPGKVKLVKEGTVPEQWADNTQWASAADYNDHPRLRPDSEIER